MTPDGRHAYVPNFGADHVSVIDTASHIVTATILVGTGPLALAVTQDGRRAYVANYGSNNVSVIEIGTA